MLEHQFKISCFKNGYKIKKDNVVSAKELIEILKDVDEDSIVLINMHEIEYIIDKAEIGNDDGYLYISLNLGQKFSEYLENTNEDII